MTMRSAVSRFLASAALACGMLSAAVPAALAESAAILDRPGVAAELRGDRSRAIAFYERDGARLDVTLLITGGAAGAEVLRSRVRLREGQRHELRLSGGPEGSAGDSYRVERLGDHVRVDVGRGAVAAVRLDASLGATLDAPVASPR